MSLRAGLLVLLLGCRGSGAAHVDGSPSDTGTDDAARDAATLDSSDSGSDDLDGTAMRLPCTGSFGTALSAAYGRLDGYLVAIVPPGPSNPCHADATHLHLQVQMSSTIYDVAVNVGTNDASNDVHTTTLDRALIGSAWSEGWHTDATVDYVTLGVHATAIPLRTQAETVAALMTDLATANHVSIYATGYSPVASGAHLVHRSTSNRVGEDGLLVTHPLSPVAHARVFSFSTQTF